MSAVYPQPIRRPRSWARIIVEDTTPHPPLKEAMIRGATNRCPICGGAPIFDGYLEVARTCANCGVPLAKVRADDAPPYFVLLITGHIIGLLIIAVEENFAPPLWVDFAIFVPLTAALVLALLRPVKGALIGVMLAMGLLIAPDS